MFARNKKCVFIAARGTAIGDENIDFCKFASPLKVPEAGPFWTNKFELSKCEELLKFAIGSSQDDWNSCSLEIRNQIMVFDPSNQKLTDLFSELGLK
jgi:surface carbohydrate biosynthesis protein